MTSSDPLRLATSYAFEAELAFNVEQIAIFRQSRETIMVLEGFV